MSPTVPEPTLAHRLTALAAERGLTINGLAHAEDIPQPRLREWAHGISYPSKKYRRRVARLVGVPVADLETEAHAFRVEKRVTSAIVDAIEIGLDVSQIPPET